MSKISTVATVATIDASDPCKQENLYGEDVIIRGHKNIHQETILSGAATSKPIDEDCESALTQHNNQSKPEPGCRQILFKRMKQRLSCEIVDNKTMAEIFVHQEPCIFCRIQRNLNNTNTKPDTKKSCACSILSENDVMVDQIITANLVPSERTVLFEIPELCDIFKLKDHFCRKHGNKYKPDYQIWKEPPIIKKKKKGKKKRTGEWRSNYITIGEVLDEMLLDDKDPAVFLNKLDCRTQPFPSHMSNDKSINIPEIPLAKDPDYGKYFRKMKKCIMCEKEADDRQKAKMGMSKCRFCNTFHHFSEDKNCSKCHQALNCNKCPGLHKCGLCELDVCTNCSDVLHCGSCGKTSCEECLEKAPFTFDKCYHCDYSYCSDCNFTYTCGMSGETFCHHCRDEGFLDCSCRKCQRQKQCDFCGERKSFDCYHLHGTMHCSLCGGISCKPCGHVYDCQICYRTFCRYCRNKSSKGVCIYCDV